MATGTGDPALVEDDDPVGEGEHFDPVRDDQYSLAGKALPQAGEDLVLGGDVDCRESVIDHQHRPVAEQGPGQGQTLALAAGELDAALADQGGISLRQFADFLIDGRACSRLDLLSVASGRPRAMLAAMVSEKRTGSWPT